MKILNLTEYHGWYVETDKGEYRCNSSGTYWEKLYGDSWEAEYSDEDLLSKLFAAKMQG